MPLLLNVDIVNAACARIGIEPLGNEGLEEDSETGQAVEYGYLEVVEFNLGVLKPSWAKTIRQLSRVEAATAYSGYDYVYDLPAERIGLPIAIKDDISRPDTFFHAYELVGQRVHSSATALYARIHCRPDPHDWTAEFKTCTITALAARLALSQASDDRLYKLLQEEAYGTPQEAFRGGLMRAALSAEAFSTPAKAPDWGGNVFERSWRGEG